jgi:PAS domain-containing protein
MNKDVTRISPTRDKFLHTLFMEMPCACMYHELVCDERGNAIDYIPTEANPAFAKVIGTDPTPIIGKRASEYMPEAAARHWLSVFAPVALDGKTVRYHMHSPQMNQTYFGTAISPEPGAFLSMFTVVGNTAIPALEPDTGRREVTETLSPKGFAKKIFETMPCAGMLSKIDVDERGKPVDYTILDVNFAFCELMDMDRSAVIGKRASERHDEREFRHWLEVFVPVAFGGSPARETTYLPRKKCACVGIAVSPAPGLVMTVFTHLDSCGYILKHGPGPKSADETRPEC